MSNDRKQIQVKLESWAKETVNVYNRIVETLNEKKPDIKWGYYTQSVLNRETLNPDILILGINPGAAGGGIMTWEELLQGNPCFKGKGDEEILFDLYKRHDPKKRKYGWDLTNKVNKMLEYAGKQTLNDLDKFVLSNMVFFGTEHQGDIPKVINQEVCAQKTLELIDILKPKVVLLLGDQSRDLFKKVIKDVEMEEIVPNYHAHVFYCFYKERHIISIYHTAFYTFYNHPDNMKVIGNIIGYALDNSLSKIDEQKLNSFLRGKMKENSEINPVTSILQQRARELKSKIKNIGTIQRKLYSGTVLLYEYFTTIKTGEYINSEDNIVIELMPEEDKNQYVILVFTRQYDAEKTKLIIKGVWPDKKFMPWACDKSRHVVETISFEEKNVIIAEKMMQVLRDVKDYRDKSFK